MILSFSFCNSMKFMSLSQILIFTFLVRTKFVLIPINFAYKISKMKITIFNAFKCCNYQIIKKKIVFSNVVALLGSLFLCRGRG